MQKEKKDYPTIVDDWTVKPGIRVRKSSKSLGASGTFALEIYNDPNEVDINWLEGFARLGPTIYFGQLREECAKTIAAARKSDFIDPLSHASTAERLVRVMNDIVALDDIRATTNAVNFASSLHTYFMARGINNAVIDGHERAGNMARGPRVKAATKQRSLSIVAAYIDEFVSANPKLKSLNAAALSKHEGFRAGLGVKLSAASLPVRRARTLQQDILDIRRNRELTVSDS